jgi:LuxR family transcriptional regulator, maltose regulon positive regulatory protein
VTHSTGRSDRSPLRHLEGGRAAGPHGAAAGSRELIFHPLLSNLQVPRPRVAVVSRRRLVAVLQRSAASLVVISAPAGSGKTLALVQWVQADERPSAWLQLDTAANDPVVLLTYLALALGCFAVVDPAVSDWLQESVTPIKSRILPLLEATLVGARPFLLVLDDAHLVRSKTCWDILRFLIEHLPTSAQVALATREDPPLPLGKMRASGLVEEIRAADLALSHDEAQELLRLHGQAVDDQTLAALLAATEGWAAGVYLAMLTAEGRAPAEWLPQIHGDEREIADYLIGEVLERQPHRTQEFLLRTSILERFSAPLCQAVTGRSDAHLVLTRLARENLFVVALDDQEEWYRYHHLFAECLRAQLFRRRPGELAGLHRAAAGWHREHGDAEQAVIHGLAAGDVEPAADLVAASCMPLLTLGQTETARRLLELFSDKQILSHAPLTLAAGWVYGVGNPHYLTQRARENIVHAACTTPMDNATCFDDWASLRSGQAQLRAFLAPDGIARMLADAELSLELESGNPAGDGYMEACKLRGIALYFTGRPDRAIGPLRVEEDRRDTPSVAGVAAEVIAFQSLIAADQGRWDEAEELAAEAWELGDPTGTDWEYSLAELLARARMLARRDAPGLDAHLERVTRFMNEMPNLFEREVIFGAVALGEIALGRDDLLAAEHWSARAQAVLKLYPDAGVLVPRAERLRLALQERRFGQAVTAAEQRVLDLLPTELSVSDIGARLFISRNTMRSHMRSLYAKLRVHSRTEAVARARELGLLRSDR